MQEFSDGNKVAPQYYKLTFDDCVTRVYELSWKIRDDTKCDWEIVFHARARAMTCFPTLRASMPVALGFFENINNKSLESYD